MIDSRNLDVLAFVEGLSVRALINEKDNKFTILQ